MLLTAARLTAAGLMAAAFVLPQNTADAQVSVRWGAGGVRVAAPGVRVSTPYYGRYYGPRSYYYGGPRRSYSYYYGRPGVTVTGAYAAPGVTVPTAPATSGVVVTSPTPAAAPTPAPAEAVVEADAVVDYSAMSGAELLVALGQASIALNERLTTFANGGSWQTYLAIDAAVGGDAEAATKLLTRFDSVATDPQFAMIAQLEEFAAVHIALQAIVSRSTAEAEPAMPPAIRVEAEGEVESLPVPGADVKVDVPGAKVDVNVERSVLIRE